MCQHGQSACLRPTLHPLLVGEVGVNYATIIHGDDWSARRSSKYSQYLWGRPQNRALRTDAKHKRCSVKQTNDGRPDHSHVTAKCDTYPPPSFVSVTWNPYSLVFLLLTLVFQSHASPLGRSATHTCATLVLVTPH